MKSILPLCVVVGAVSDASTCQADESTLLQGRSLTRHSTKKHQMTSHDSKAILQNMRDVANSLLEGSDTTMSEDTVSDALDAAGEALAELAAAIVQHVENAQRQIDDASSGFQACPAQEQASLQESLGQRAAAVESCHNELDQLRAAETQQCDIAEDCLCDEARVRTTDHEALCAAMTETYEAAFCEHHTVCTVLHQCHSVEAEVYQRLRADVEAEMALVVQEYIAVEQSRCLNGLSREALTPPRTPIDLAAMQACDDVDVSALSISFPDLPAEPAACPAHAHGDPPCVVSLLSGNAACPQCTCELSRPDGPWGRSGSGCGSAFDDNLRWGPGSGVHVNAATLTLTFPAPVSIDHIDLHHEPYYTRYNPHFSIETFSDGAWTVRGRGTDFPIGSDGSMEPVLGFQFAAPVLATQVRLISQRTTRVEELQVFGRLA